MASDAWASWEFEELEIVHINEIKGDATCQAHLLELGSVHIPQFVSTLLECCH